MDFFVKLPKNLLLTEDEIIKYWNENDEFTEVAVARKTEKKEQHYAVITLTDVYITLGAIGVNIASSVIYDLLKNLIIKKANLKQEQLKFTEKSNPDHTKSIEVQVIDAEENTTSNQPSSANSSNQEK